jgi:hypothetical protein
MRWEVGREGGRECCSDLDEVAVELEELDAVVALVAHGDVAGLAKEREGGGGGGGRAARRHGVE